MVPGGSPRDMFLHIRDEVLDEAEGYRGGIGGQPIQDEIEFEYTLCSG
jgi:hypothetical protein